MPISTAPAAAPQTEGITVGHLLVAQSRAQRLLGDVDRARANAELALAVIAALPSGAGLDRIRVRARRGLGEVLLHVGDHAAARECFLAALEDAERTLGNLDMDTASLLNSLGAVARQTGDFDEAEWRYARALAIVEASAADGRGDHGVLTEILLGLDELGEAEGPARGALAIVSSASGGAHRKVAKGPTSVGALLHRAQRLDQAGREDRAWSRAA